MENKKKSSKTDWDSPEGRYKKQTAFRLYVAERPIGEITKALGVNKNEYTKGFILNEKWEDHKKLWLENPDKEMPYPWEEQRALNVIPPPPDMATMDKNKRLQCIKAFSMYCTGQNLPEIANELGVSYSVVRGWMDTQRWKACRERLVDESAPAPWENENVPTVLSDITASLESMKKSIKFLTGQVLVKAADAAQDLTGDQALGMMRNIKQLVEAAQMNFSDGTHGGNPIQINIATKLESMKIPNNQTFDAELVVNE
jgi:hypothetical protein